MQRVKEIRKTENNIKKLKKGNQQKSYINSNIKAKNNIMIS